MVLSKKAVLLIVFVVLLSSIVFAEDSFLAKIEPQEVVIKQDETAEFDLTITHTADKIKTFEIYSTNVIWDVRMQDALRVEPSTMLSTKLFIRPLNVNPGSYWVPLIVEMTGTDKKDEKHILLEIESLIPPEQSYLPAVRGEVYMEDDVDPREELKIRVNLENQNRRDLKNVNIKIRSSTINKDYAATLEPLEKKELRFFVKLPPFTAPQKDLLKVSIIVPEKDQAYRFDMDPVSFEVVDYSDFQQEVKIEEGFLKTTYLATLKNNGNEPYEDVYKVESSFFKNIFVTTVPRAQKMKGQLVWNIDLAPGESELIMYTFNYQPLLIVAIALIIISLAYVIFRSPVILKKTATVIATKEGGISELKVIVELVNRSRKPIKHIRLIDTIPRIANLVQDYDIGTLKPDKAVKHERKGTLVKWSIESIDPGEERVISYKIKSKLSILGGMTLPSAAVKFDAGKRHRTANSNSPVVGFIG